MPYSNDIWIRKAKEYLLKHSTVIDSGTYGSGYTLCACCFRVANEKHRKDCELADLLDLPTD